MTLKERYQAFLKPKSTLEKIFIIIIMIYLLIAFITTVIALVGRNGNPEWWFLQTKFYLFFHNWKIVIQVWIIGGMIIAFMALQFILMRKLKGMNKFASLHSQNKAQFKVLSDLKIYIEQNLEKGDVITGVDLIGYITDRIDGNLKTAAEFLKKIKPNE